MEDQGLHYWYSKHFVNLWICYLFAGFVFSDCDGGPADVPPLPVLQALCGEGEHSSTNHLQLLRPCRGANQWLLGQIFLAFLDDKLFRKVDKWCCPGEAGRGRHRSLCLRHLARCYRPLLQQVLKLLGLELIWHDRPGRYHVPNTYGVQVGQNKTARPVHPIHASASTWRGGKHGAKVPKNIIDIKIVCCHYLLILKMLGQPLKADVCQGWASWWRTSSLRWIPAAALLSFQDQSPHPPMQEGTFWFEGIKII